MAFTIRLAKSSEFSDVDHIANEAWHSLKDGYDPAQWEWLLGKVSQMSTLHTVGQLLVAERSAGLAGAVVYVPQKKH